MWDWGDGTVSGWLGPTASGEQASASHAWAKTGVYQIKVKAKDIHHAESSWSSLTVTIRLFEVDLVPLDPPNPPNPGSNPTGTP
jgi:hypothetical protein